MSTSYDAIRSSVVSSGTHSRVEVNQRALIDKILARYASAGAVYRELIQNSNDAEANTAQIKFTTTEDSAGRLISQVVYRNDGHPFRPQDWQRLRKIAEGNPDVAKVGAFGVGAYTMFSICEEPLVISGKEALTFAWKGDALWTKTGPSPHPVDQWTTFVLPSRDPYPVPNLVEFGQFLCTSLTFTQCLHTIIVSVDEKVRLTISKRQLQPPTVVTPPKSSSWWSNDGALTHSPRRIFTLGRGDGSITETVIEMTATLDNEVSSITARYVSALANVRVPHDVANQMYRVTKKKPPKEVNIQIFIDAAAKRGKRKRTHADAIIESFSPAVGNGSIFIGFKTSQTTGLAAHLAAPLVPTVEREAVDLQNPSLKVFNSELLYTGGILMRLTLEHSMSVIGRRWDDTKDERLALEKKLRNEKLARRITPTKEGSVEGSHEDTLETEPQKSKGTNDWFGFANFMSSGVKRFAKVISSVATGASDEEDLLNPEDPRPLSAEEEEAITLMCSFCPEQSTPDPHVGALIAEGFAGCMMGISPPVLTTSGVVRSSESRLPYHGIERFVTEGVIRKVVQRNADSYLRYVAGCNVLSLSDLERVLPETPMSQEDLAIFLKWWIKFCRLHPELAGRGPALKAKMHIVLERSRKEENNGDDVGNKNSTALDRIRYYKDERMYPDEIPMPPVVLPREVHKLVTQRLLEDKFLASWFAPLPFRVWASYICKHSCLTAGRHAESDIRLLALATLSKEYMSRTAGGRANFEKWLVENLSNKRCIPYHFYVPEPQATDYPGDLYLSSAEISLFEGLGSFKKVSVDLSKAGVSDEFLVALGVRKTISIDFLFTQLDNLKWSGDPKPLISYLCKATLTDNDLLKLKTTKYLPADDERSSAYAPSELHLPNEELVLFPFARSLYWPSTDELSERSPERRFLKELGCRVDPDLKAVLTHITQEGTDDTTRSRVLLFVSERLKPGGSYEHVYSSRSTSSSSRPSEFRSIKFLPVARKDPLSTQAPRKELQSPMQCFTDLDILCMGFAVLDPSLQRKHGKALGERFLCRQRPPADHLVSQVLNIASFAKAKAGRLGEESDDFLHLVLASFKDIFDYLSTRTKEFDKDMRENLREEPFIPCHREGKLEWLRPTEVYFRNENSDTGELTSTLFCVTDYNPFLAIVGVQSELSLKNLFDLVVSSPKLVLDKLGSVENYFALLRKLASNVSSFKLTAKAKSSPFLLGFHMREIDSKAAPEGSEDSTEKRTFVFAKAKDISIIDDSILAPMFNALCAPQESDLEKLYIHLGSEYISKRVQRKGQLHGSPQKETSLTKEFITRIEERKPLLVSKNLTSLSLLPNAETMLRESNMNVYEVGGLSVSYALDQVVRTREVTCFADSHRTKRISVYIVPNFNWFDVGVALGKVILQKYRIQDAYFIGSLLEAQLEHLRARGLPVDRVLKKSDYEVQSAEDPSRSRVTHAKNENRARPSPSEVRETASENSPGPNDGDGFLDILTQMFPDCDPEHIQSLLGKAPTLDTLREVANSLSDGRYPKRVKARTNEELPNNTRPQPQTQSQTPTATPTQTHPSPSSSSKGAGSNALSRALRGMKQPVGSGGRLLSFLGKSHRSEQDVSSRPVPPSHDVSAQRHMEKLLRNSVKSSRKIPAGGITSPESVEPIIPEDVKLREENCEVVPGHNLKPYPGKHGTGKTRNGIRVFSSRRDANSELFLNANFDAVEAFSGILQTVSTAYSLELRCVAIFHEAGGRTIAFNSSGALHFNLRFFASLHWPTKNLDAPCYSYWFTVMAHELAHNIAKGHGRDHGFLTESYVITYLPRLVEVLK